MKIRKGKASELSIAANMKRRLRSVVRRMLPDRVFINRRSVAVLGRKMHLRRPKTFNEKLNWLKLYHRDPLLTQLADKYAVRQYVESRVGPDVLNELYGVWDNVDAIDLTTLPQRFVLKATHGSRWNVICRDKSKLDWEAVKLQLKKWLDTNYYYFVCREWCYKHIQPRIICERLLEDDSGKSPSDYKFFCFNGQPRITQVDIDRFTNHQRNFYDLNWQRLPFTLGVPNYPGQVTRPDNLEQMLSMAGRLSEGLPFCRVDFYSIEEKAIFGELTFYPLSGLGKFQPESFDRLFGDYLQLPATVTQAWRRRF